MKALNWIGSNSKAEVFQKKAHAEQNAWRGHICSCAKKKWKKVRAYVEEESVASLPSLSILSYSPLSIWKIFQHSCDGAMCLWWSLIIIFKWIM